MNAAVATGRPQGSGGPAPWFLAAWALVLAVWLAFAFAPAQGGLAWVRSAQVACFGTLEDGLPSPWGWTVLGLAPLSLLAGLLAVYGRELREWLRGWRDGGASWIAAFAVAMLLSLTLGWSLERLQRARAARATLFAPASDEALPEGYPRVDLPLPPFKLVDQQGRRTGPADLAGRPALLSFVFAHCTTVCPRLAGSMQSALADGQAAPAFYISLDPWRDTAAALPALAQRLGLRERDRLLTGEPARVQAVLSALQVETLRDPKTGDIGHAPWVYVLDRRGHVAYRFLQPSPRWLREALQRLNAEP